MKSVIKQTVITWCLAVIIFPSQVFGFFLVFASGHFNTSDVSLLGQIYLDQQFSQVCSEHQSFHDGLIHKDGPQCLPTLCVCQAGAPSSLRSSDGRDDVWLTLSTKNGESGLCLPETQSSALGASPELGTWYSSHMPSTSHQVRNWR